MWPPITSLLEKEGPPRSGQWRKDVYGQDAEDEDELIFGYGRRSCLGKSVASLWLPLANIAEVLFSFFAALTLTQRTLGVPSSKMFPRVSHRA